MLKPIKNMFFMVLKINYRGRDGYFPKRLLNSVSDRKGNLCEGAVGAATEGQLTLCSEGAQEEVHLGAEPRKTHHDRKGNTRGHRTPLPRQTQNELPGLTKTLLPTRVLPRRRTFQSTRSQRQTHRGSVLPYPLRAKFYCAQIVLALEILHKNKVIYRE